MKPVRYHREPKDRLINEFTPEEMWFERRTSKRFPLEFPAELCFREQRISARTANISSGGLLVICSDSEFERTHAKVGARVKVRITGWPSSRPNNTNLELIVEGVVVRKWTGYVAVRRDRRSEFVKIRRKRIRSNQTPPEVEAQILEITERYPTYSYIRISDQLKLVGVGLSPYTVRAVWQRHGLTSRIHRLRWLQQKTEAQAWQPTPQNASAAGSHPPVPSVAEIQSPQLAERALRVGIVRLFGN